MDEILAKITVQQLVLVEDQLSNNDVSSDDELRDFFIETGMTEAQAIRALSYRTDYLCNLFLRGDTPILKGADALRFDPLLGAYVRWK